MNANTDVNKGSVRPSPVNMQQPILFQTTFEIRQAEFGLSLQEIFEKRAKEYVQKLQLQQHDMKTANQVEYMDIP